MSERIVLVTGSRGWNNDVIIHDALKQLMDENLDVNSWTLVHGGCYGADHMTAKLAHQLGWKLIEMAVTPSDWAKHGKRAGIIRNSEMINVHQPHHALAFQIGDSPGTYTIIPSQAT
jgi:hypothetical protein